MKSEVTFSDLTVRGSLAVNDGYRTKASELGSPGYPVLRVAEIGDGFISPSYGDHVRTEYRGKIGQKLSHPRDVLLTTKGTVGRRAIMPDVGVEFAYSPQLCFFRVLDDSIDHRWLYYWLGSSAFWSQALRVSTQTDMAPYISLRDLRAIRLVLPPISEQRGIATTLGALDDKIESDRRLAHLSLQVAEVLYNRACADGADVMTLKEAGQWLSGGTPSTSVADYWDGDLPWISAANLKSFYIETSDRRLTKEGAAAGTRVVPPGTIVMVVRGMSLKSELRFGVTQRDVAFGQDCKAILPKVGTANLALALLANRDEILALVDEAGHGTGRLASDRLEAFRVQIPSAPEFSAIGDSLLARGAQAAREGRLLAGLRDSLLPELLSGRIRVPEAQEAVAKVGA